MHRLGRSYSGETSATGFSFQVGSYIHDNLLAYPHRKFFFCNPFWSPIYHHFFGTLICDLPLSVRLPIPASHHSGTAFKMLVHMHVTLNSSRRFT